MVSIVTHTTRASGTVLTASIYNTDHIVHITNAQNLNNTKLEGATPPVTAGNVAVFADTSGTLLEDGGIVAANAARTLTAGTGLTGGGDLSADRSFAVDFASQAEAEGGTDTANVMNALRTRQQVVAFQATQAEAEAAADNTKIMTSLRVRQQAQAFFASQAEAEAGSDNTKFMTPLRTAEAIAALVQAISVGSAINTFDSGSSWDTGILGSASAAFLLMGDAATTPGNLQISLNGGTNFTGLWNTATKGNPTRVNGIAFVSSGVVTFMGWGDDNGSPTQTLTRVTPTAGAGNIFFNTSTSNNWQGIKVIG